METLKEILLKEISNVTSELRDLKQDFSCLDSRLIQFETKLSGYEKVHQTQKEIKRLQEEVSIIKNGSGKLDKGAD